MKDCRGPSAGLQALDSTRRSWETNNMPCADKSSQIIMDKWIIMDYNGLRWIILNRSMKIHEMSDISTYWSLVGNCQERSIITRNFIIPATPSNPSIPYVKRTSKSIQEIPERIGSKSPRNNR